MLIKAPWFTTESSIYILLIIKCEQNFVVAKILNFETTPSSPQWCECSSYDLHVDSSSCQKISNNGKIHNTVIVCETTPWPFSLGEGKLIPRMSQIVQVTYTSTVSQSLEREPNKPRNSLAIPRKLSTPSLKGQTNSTM